MWNGLGKEQEEGNVKRLLYMAQKTKIIKDEFQILAEGYSENMGRL